MVQQISRMAKYPTQQKTGYSGALKQVFFGQSIVPVVWY